MRPVGLVLLAAGGSRRLGRPKQLLRFEGESLLRRAARAALGSPCRPVIVVLGAGRNALAPEVRGLPLLAVEHEGWEAGMGSSLRRGLEALASAEPSASGVVVMVCDQPRLGSAHLAALLARAEATGAALVASRYEGELGVPAFFARSVFPELLALPDAAGGRTLLRRDGEGVEAVAFDGGELDVDTEADYARLCASAELRPPGPRGAPELSSSPADRTPPRRSAR